MRGVHAFSGHRGMRGSSLIEVLIAILLLSLAVLGMALAQATVLRRSQGSQERATAVLAGISLGDLMAIDPFTGGRRDESFFDLDGDGMVGGPGDLVDAEGTPVPSSGYLVGQGPNGPTFIGDWLGVSLQDGSTTGVITRTIGNTVRRVSWREILWMGSDDDQ